MLNPFILYIIYIDSEEWAMQLYENHMVLKYSNKHLFLERSFPYRLIIFQSTRRKRNWPRILYGSTRIFVPKFLRKNVVSTKKFAEDRRDYNSFSLASFFSSFWPLSIYCLLCNDMHCELNDSFDGSFDFLCICVYHNIRAIY